MAEKECETRARRDAAAKWTIFCVTREVETRREASPIRAYPIGTGATAIDSVKNAPSRQ